MISKKEAILETALDLFSSEGYASTPTSKIGRQAGVSEGLIFRHFENKRGLLAALMEEAEERQAEALGPILMESNPKKAIRKFIKLPFRKNEPRNLKLNLLQAIIKWEPQYNKGKKNKIITDKLRSAFAKMHYKDPENEALLLIILMENISTELLKGRIQKSIAFRDFLLKKYKLN